MHVVLEEVNVSLTPTDGRSRKWTCSGSLQFDATTGAESLSLTSESEFPNVAMTPFLHTGLGFVGDKSEHPLWTALTSGARVDVTRRLILNSRDNDDDVIRQSPNIIVSAHIQPDEGCCLMRVDVSDGGKDAGIDSAELDSYLSVTELQEFTETQRHRVQACLSGGGDMRPENANKAEHAIHGFAYLCFNTGNGGRLKGILTSAWSFQMPPTKPSSVMQLQKAVSCKTSFMTYMTVTLSRGEEVKNLSDEDDEKMAEEQSEEL